MANESYDKWTVSALTWDPTLDSRLNARRKPARPKTRWTDDINHHIQTHGHNESNSNATFNNGNHNSTQTTDRDNNPRQDNDTDYDDRHNDDGCTDDVIAGRDEDENNEGDGDTRQRYDERDSYS